METQAIKHWVCIGCGYIAEGDRPPAECPVCKAPKRAFYPRQFMPAAPPVQAAREHKVKPAPSPDTIHWVCLGCGHIYEGNNPPDNCPICQAPRDAFKPRQFIHLP